MIEQLLHFWFIETVPAQGWRVDPAFDAKIAERFSAVHAAAVAGELYGWRVQPRGRLAEILVLDQFSRNLYRGDARAFSQDARALACAEEMLARGWDARLLPVERQFAYLPFEHAEDLAMQDRSVSLFASLEAFPETKGLTEWAEKHRVIVRRFGRFPHRNAALGRESTPEETAFLREPGSSF